MARAHNVVVLALVMFAIIGMTFASEAPMPSEDDYELDDDSEFMIGARAGGSAPSPDSVVAAPIGGPVPPGAFDSPPDASAPSSDASSLQHLSVVGTAAAIAGFFYF